MARGLRDKESNPGSPQFEQTILSIHHRASQTQMDREINELRQMYEQPMAIWLQIGDTSHSDNNNNNNNLVWWHCHRDAPYKL